MNYIRLFEFRDDFPALLMHLVPTRNIQAPCLIPGVN